MVRPKGSLNKTEPKNRSVRLRLTAREYAQIILVAKYTNHSINDILRKFVNDGLIQHKEILKIVNCSTINDIAKRYFHGSSSSSRTRRWTHLLDRSDTKKPLEELEVNPLTEKPLELKEDQDRANKYLSALEETLKKPELSVLVRETLKLQKRDYKEKNKNQGPSVKDRRSVSPLRLPFFMLRCLCIIHVFPFGNRDLRIC